MRLFTAIALGLWLGLFLPLVGCSANPAAAPAAIRAAASIYVITDPAVCDEVPFAGIHAAIAEAEGVLAESEALCASVEPAPME